MKIKRRNRSIGSEEEMKIKTGKEIYEEILEYADAEGKHELDNVKFIDIQEIYQLAYDFECCPHCGRVDIESHFCPHCKERIAIPYNCDWFAEYLKKKFKLISIPKKENEK